MNNSTLHAILRRLNSYIKINGGTINGMSKIDRVKFFCEKENIPMPKKSNINDFLLSQYLDKNSKISSSIIPVRKKTKNKYLLDEKRKTLFGRLKKLRENATESELIFKSRLDDAGIKYIFQKGFIKGRGYCIVDFYITKPYKMCVEIDGGYHNTYEQKSYDKWRDGYLKERGFRVIRIKNEDVLDFDLSKLTVNDYRPLWQRPQTPKWAKGLDRAKKQMLLNEVDLELVKKMKELGRKQSCYTYGITVGDYEGAMHKFGLK
jgi:very-short-patch-repair endonuclease